MERLKSLTGGLGADVAFDAGGSRVTPDILSLDSMSVVFEFPEVVGLSVSTRPDLVPDAVLDLLAEFAERLHVWLELGVQSFHYRSLVKVRRYHGVAESIDAILRAHSHGLDVVAHMILGLPGETESEIVENARILSALGVHGVYGRSS